MNEQLPQFLVTFLSAIIFYLMEPTRPSLPEGHSGPNSPVKANITVSDEDVAIIDTDIVEGESGVERSAKLLARAVVHAMIHDRGKREVEAHVKGGADSVGLVFRQVGIALFSCRDLNNSIHDLQVGRYQCSHRWYHVPSYVPAMGGRIWRASATVLSRGSLVRASISGGKRDANKCQAYQIWDSHGA